MENFNDLHSDLCRESIFIWECGLGRDGSSAENITNKELCDIVGALDGFGCLFRRALHSVGLQGAFIDDFVEIESAHLYGQPDEFVEVPLQSEVVVGVDEGVDRRR